MPRNDDGEFELVLGNRQLLSVFFIVVILLGVFFTMGYIVGRNSAPLGAMDTARRTDVSKPAEVDSAAATPSPTPGQPSASAAEPPPDSTRADASKARPTETTPATETRKPSAAAPAEKPVESASSSILGDTPQSGQAYLQVAAVGKPEAQLFVDVLNKKGFQAIYAQAPGSNGLYRVLVGPVKDAANVAKARTDLENAGFKGYEAIVRKY